MNIQELISKLEEYKKKFFGNYGKVLIQSGTEHPIDIEEFDIGVIGNHGEFVSSKEVTSQNWDSILDTIVIKTKQPTNQFNKEYQSIYTLLSIDGYEVDYCGFVRLFKMNDGRWCVDWQESYGTSNKTTEEIIESYMHINFNSLTKSIECYLDLVNRLIIKLDKGDSEFDLLGEDKKAFISKYKEC